MGTRRGGIRAALALTAATVLGGAFAVAASAQGPGDYQPSTTTTTPTTTTTTTTVPNVDGRIELSVRARKQKLRSSVKVKVGCGAEACYVGAAGTLKVKRGRGKKRPHRTFDLVPGAATPAPNATAALKLKIPRAAEAAAKRALDGGGKAKASIALAAIDAAGNTATENRKVKLKR